MISRLKVYMMSGMWTDRESEEGEVVAIAECHDVLGNLGDVGAGVDHDGARELVVDGLYERGEAIGTPDARSGDEDELLTPQEAGYLSVSTVCIQRTGGVGGRRPRRARSSSRDRARRGVLRLTAMVPPDGRGRHLGRGLLKC